MPLLEPHADRGCLVPVPAYDHARASLQEQEELDWMFSATGIEELVLWLVPHSRLSSAQEISLALKWVHWAASLPRLEVRDGEYDSLEVADVLWSAVRAEGEDAETMVERLLQDIAWEGTHAGT